LLRGWLSRAGCAALFAGSFVLSSPALAQEPVDPLPAPEGIRDRVDFWKSVYAGWSLTQVALHDVDHPTLVYGVLDLHGPAEERYTDEQSAYVRACREELESRLRVLERKVLAGEPLDDREKELALRVTTTAGGDAILGAHARVRSQRGMRERFRRGIEISYRYDATFREIFREAGLPEDLAYLPHVESSYQAHARSSAGAVGVWQFTRPAAKIFMNVTSTIDERLDPVASARGAARYLARAHGLLGDWALSVTSYNHGIEGMVRAKERFGTDFERIVEEYDGRAFGFASKSFYAEFLAAREIAKDPGTYFPEGFTAEPPLSHDSVRLERPASPVQLARTYGIELGALATLNPAWTRRAIKNGLALPTGTEVWLPQGTMARMASLPAPRPEPVAVAASSPKSARAAEAPPVHAVHVVERGESLFHIASAYGVRMADLLGLNRLTERSVIHPGQRLRIPLSR
jgi:membrane-bound lytic murein transglycosylase D